jgi:flavin-dependent dehydrogenase
MEKMDADVLIIGAGPVGSVAARMLKKLGRQAVILEKEQFPRFSIGKKIEAIAGACPPLPYDTP